MAAGATYTAIETKTLTSLDAAVEFLEIPGTYTDLVMVSNFGAVTATNTYIRFNGDVGANYSMTQLIGTGSSALSTRENSLTAIRVDNYSAAQTTIKSAYIFNIQNYSNSTTYKILFARCNDASAGVELTVARWSSTDPITSIKFYPGIVGNTWLVDSTFTLYGIKAA